MAQPSPHPEPHADPAPPGARWNFAAALAAWLVPGLGHVLIGQAKRGIILMVTISLLWFAGLVVGGISVIDSANNTAWFLGQMMVSPSVIVDQVHRHLRAENLAENQSVEPLPAENNLHGEPPTYEPALGRVQEQATLYTALAGLLNLLAILDVLYRDGRKDALLAEANAAESPAAAPAAPTSPPPPGGDGARSFSALSLGPMPLVLGYRFLLEPLPLDRYWLVFLIPLSVAIAVAYKTIRLPDLRQLPHDAAWLSLQIIAFMLLAAAALWLLTELT